jgi:speckle-type POZ protein
MGSAFHQFDVNYGQVKQLAIGSALDSEVFLAGGHRWRIKLYPRGCTVSDNGDYLSIYLELLNKSHVKIVNAFFEAFLMDKNGQPSPVDARTRVCSWQTSNWGWDRFIPVVYLEESYVSNGVVSILFAVVVMSDNSIPVPPPDIGKHLGTLLDTMDGADVSFTIDGETFHAHRAVLAARSPVFRAKLYESTSDGATLSITLHKISPKTFRMMLAFIYTDALTEDDESVPATVFHNLLVAADHYALDRLKHLCAQKLLDDVALDTVLTTLTCAEIYSCPELKNKCLDFIAAKANDNFLFSVDYIQLAVNFPSIIPDLLQRRSNFGYQQQTHQLWPSDSECPSCSSISFL